MRVVRLAVLPFLFAASLAAQTPSTRTTSDPVPTMRSVMFDVAALVDDRQRFGVEPLVLGRLTVGLVGAHTKTGNAADVYYGQPVLERHGETLPPIRDGIRCCIPPEQGYDAWSLDLSIRYYPAAFSFSNPQHRLMLYIGEFVGYHRRRLEQQYYPWINALGGSPTDPTVRADTIIPPPLPPEPPYPPYPPYPPSRFLQRFKGFEPGAEVGVRLIPLPPVFIDVGGWFKLVTIDDPMQRLRPGQVDARLVVAFGVGW